MHIKITNNDLYSYRILIHLKYFFVKNLKLTRRHALMCYFLSNFIGAGINLLTSNQKSNSNRAICEKKGLRPIKIHIGLINVLGGGTTLKSTFRTLNHFWEKFEIGHFN